jgi:hypothetical protein
MWLWNPGDQESDSGDRIFGILGVEMGGGQGGAPRKHLGMPLENGKPLWDLCCWLAQLPPPSPVGSQTCCSKVWLAPSMLHHLASMGIQGVGSLLMAPHPTWCSCTPTLAPQIPPRQPHSPASLAHCWGMMAQTHCSGHSSSFPAKLNHSTPIQPPQTPQTLHRLRVC